MEYAKFQVGDFIQVRSALEGGTEHPGWIVKVKPNAVDIVSLSGAGLQFRPDCWHEEDERIPVNRELLSGPLFTGRGIFREARRDAPSALERRVQALEEQLDYLVSAVDKLEQVVYGDDEKEAGGKAAKKTAAK
ncbi:MAG: hypothetical protein ONB06_04040 [candidate division KSB1 bacterium]|nr:hypothetical protein [candidate division KSB1 bacterium]